jgi:hypothetical protein
MLAELLGGAAKELGRRCPESQDFPERHPLLYFRESDAGRAVAAIVREWGLAWQSHVVETLSQSPWMLERGLSSVASLLEMVSHYAALTDQLVDSGRFPMLALAAPPESYQARTNALIERVTACA